MLTAGAGARERTRSERVGPWVVTHAVEIAFALLVVAAFAYSLRLTRSYFFFLDDWLLVKQGSSLSGWFRPYSDQMGVIIIGAWRVLAELFGFTFTPFRVVGMAGLYAVPLTYLLTTRRQFGAVLAALLALPLLWYGRYISFIPAQLDHFLVLLGGVGCAAALNRGRRADWILAGSLTFALCAGGGGSAVAAACVVHNLCTRAPLRRWLAVLVPSFAWLVWWLIEVGRASDLHGYSMTTSQVLTFVRDLGYTPFESAALGVGAVAMVLMAAFVAYGIWTLSKGLNAGANFVAWSTGFLVWAVGVGVNRGLLFASVTVFRYRYVALGLLLLAVVPRLPIAWPARFPLDRDRRFVIAGALLVLVLGAARGLAVTDDMRATADIQTPALVNTRAETLVIQLGPGVVADHTKLPFEFGWLRASEVRAMFADYGNPFPPGRAAADQQLVEMGRVRSDAVAPRRVGCTPLTEPFSYAPSDDANFQYLWSPSAFAVDVRRFGDRWVRLDEVEPGAARRLTLPDLGSNTPWRVRANGACRLGER